MIKKLVLGLLAAASAIAAVCIFDPTEVQAQEQPCQWNYANVAGVATATYCGNVNVNGIISAVFGPFANGTLGAPSITFVGDTTTGFYLPGPGSIYGVVAGVAAFGANTHGFSIGPVANVGSDDFFHMEEAPGGVNANMSFVMNNENPAGALTESVIHMFTNLHNPADGADMRLVVAGAGTGGFAQIIAQNNTSFDLLSSGANANMSFYVPSASCTTTTCRSMQLVHGTGAVLIDDYTDASTPGVNASTQLVVKNENAGASASVLFNMVEDTASRSVTVFSSGVGSGNANLVQDRVAGDAAWNFVQAANASIVLLTNNTVFMTFSGSHQVYYKGTAPAISGGTGTTIAGNDNVGRIIVGTGTPTSFTLTFNATWPIAPICQFKDETTNVVQTTITPSTTAVTFVMASGIAANDRISYECIGYN